MKGRTILVVLALLLVCGPAWAKGGHGGGHGGGGGQGIGHGEGQGHGHDHDTGSADHDGPPEGSLPPGLARKDKLPPGLEKQGKTPEGWSKGEKKGWFHKIWPWGRKDDSD